MYLTKIIVLGFDFLVDPWTILQYRDRTMARKKTEGNTRQIFASIREELYLAAKARATEQRMSLREFIEDALDQALSSIQENTGGPEQHPKDQTTPSVWDDEYLRMQIQQPLGSPVELTKEEAERVVRATFGQDAGHTSNPDINDG